MLKNTHFYCCILLQSHLFLVVKIHVMLRVKMTKMLFKAKNELSKMIY